MVRRKKQFLTLAVLISLVWLVAAQATPRPAPWANLLQNPRFQQGLEGWTPWYYENIVMNKDTGQTASPDPSLSLYQPYFMVSEYKWDRETHGKDEEGAAAGAVSGTHYTKFRAGFFQSGLWRLDRASVLPCVNGFVRTKDRRGVLFPRALALTLWRDRLAPTNIQWVDAGRHQQYKMPITPQVRQMAV
jgi:hypothetical protein